MDETQENRRCALGAATELVSAQRIMRRSKQDEGTDWANWTLDLATMFADWLGDASGDDERRYPMRVWKDETQEYAKGGPIDGKEAQFAKSGPAVAGLSDILRNAANSNPPYDEPRLSTKANPHLRGDGDGFGIMGPGMYGIGSEVEVKSVVGWGTVTRVGSATNGKGKGKRLITFNRDSRPGQSDASDWYDTKQMRYRRPGEELTVERAPRVDTNPAVASPPSVAQWAQKGKRVATKRYGQGLVLGAVKGTDPTAMVEVKLDDERFEQPIWLKLDDLAPLIDVDELPEPPEVELPTMVVPGRGSQVNTPDGRGTVLAVTELDDAVPAYRLTVVFRTGQGVSQHYRLEYPGNQLVRADASGIPLANEPAVTMDGPTAAAYYRERYTPGAYRKGSGLPPVAADLSEELRDPTPAELRSLDGLISVDADPATNPTVPHEVEEAKD